MPETEENEIVNAPFVAEPLFAAGGRIFTMDMGLNLCSIARGPDNGVTEREQRHWAALLAAAPAMQAFIRRIASGMTYGEHPCLMRDAAVLLMQSQPKPKGMPFKRLGPRLGYTKRLNVDASQ